MFHPGPRNLITDVPGILVGNAEDVRARTGTTVVRPEPAALAAVDVRGGAPGTREISLLAPDCRVDRVDAIVLSGGSAIGLDAASGASRWLAANRRGVEVAGFHIPIVPAAIVFDLVSGGDKNWGEEPPYLRLGREACANAAADFALGNIGAGLGSRAGTIKGGLGSASANTDFDRVDVTKTWSRKELEPYETLFGLGSPDVVMVAHILERDLDPDLPASLSPKVVDGLLRQELGWDGPVITDSLGATAISSVYDRREAAALALEAGNDLLLYANQGDYVDDLAARLIDDIEALVASGRITEARIDESIARIEPLAPSN